MSSRRQDQAIPSRHRQQPGLACESCRKKKSRCDRQRPGCGECAETGIKCIFNDHRPPRGPKKGQLKALRTRVVTLERRLSSAGTDPFAESLSPLSLEASTLAAVPEFDNATPSQETPLDVVAQDTVDCDGAVDLGVISPVQTARSESGSVVASSRRQDTVPPSCRSTAPFCRQSIVSLTSDIVDLEQADLDQLYFDRVHPIAPVIQKTRYFSWAYQEGKSEARLCLQSAMRLLAAAVSTQFQGLRDSLYTNTRQMLERLEEGERYMAGSFFLEQIQAWLLVALYEFMRMPHRRGMVTAGRTFRMLQVSRLYEVDAFDIALGDFSEVSSETWVETEEKRRVFWMAYCLDRFVSLHDEWPLTLHEEDIRTRLPAPETNFESNVPVRMALLSEAIASSGQGVLSPFAECIALATVFGRCASHRRRAQSETVYGSDSKDFWARHQWLDDILNKRMQHLSQRSPADLRLVDPLLIFNHLLGQTAVISLMDTMQAKPWHTVEHQRLVMEYERRAVEAASEIVLLSKSVARISCFKVHPFSPSAFFHGLRLLMAHVDLPDTLNSGVTSTDGAEQLLDVLRRMKNVNNLARDLLHMVEPDGPQEPSQPYKWVPSFLNGWTSRDSTAEFFEVLS